MKRYLAFAAVAMALFSPGVAFALSCMAPNMDETVIGGAVMIFEGTAGRERPLDPRETAAVREQGLKSTGGIENFMVSPFTVTRGWKGVENGDEVNVLLDTYWGDRFATGAAWLVVSPQRVGELYALPLCGNSADINYAADSGMLDTLRRVIGGY
ncbi:MAG: hypothetical protein IMF05_13080 [Proteobacteria bacterium]|nr:hypothetical protein [Pseudomonadota bacterium]